MATQVAGEGRFQDGQRWREENGVVYFEVTSNGRTGLGWIEYLEKRGFRLSKRTKQVLGSSDFKPTSGVTYRIAIIKGILFADSDRVINKIRAEAARRNLEAPNAEVACLIREKFSDEELEIMGLWCILVLHERINDSDGYPILLGVDCVDGGCWLSVYYVGLDECCSSGGGFAFALPAGIFRSAL